MNKEDIEYLTILLCDDNEERVTKENYDKLRKALFYSIVPKYRRNKINPDEIATLLDVRFNINHNSKSRPQAIIEIIEDELVIVRDNNIKNEDQVEFRYICWCMLKKYTTMTLGNIGELFINKKGKPRDHSTISVGLKTAKNFMQTDKAFNYNVVRVINRLDLEFRKKI